MTCCRKIALLAAAILMTCGIAAEERERDSGSAAAFDPGMGAAVERAPVAVVADPCTTPELTAAPSRPVWTAGAATTQCSVLETDYGWQWQGMGAGVRQTAAAMSVRYGLTPRLDLRWGVPALLMQSGGGAALVHGVSDQSLSFTYRFQEQGQRLPALAVGYGFKIPTANPAKGFGSGYVDHQLAFIASRDVGRLHFDFNTVGILGGGRGGFNGATQCGFVLSSAASRQVTWLLEGVGGSQPGTEDRLGQATAGVQWSVRPWLVVDTAYTRAYTAGSPRQQFTVGWTWSTRPGAVAQSRARMRRLLGR